MSEFQAVAEEFEPGEAVTHLRVVQPTAADESSSDATIIEFGHGHDSAPEMGSLIYAW
jgi:hypothetical protein